MSSGHRRSYGAAARSGLIGALLLLTCLAERQPAIAQQEPNSRSGAHQSAAPTIPINKPPKPPPAPQATEDPHYYDKQNIRIQGQLADAQDRIVSLTGWIVGIGVVQAIIFCLTLFGTTRAANAANKAAEALPVLERAYVYPRIMKDNVYITARNPKLSLDDDLRLQVTFLFKNFGKTPARLISGEVELHRTPPDDTVTNVTQWPVGYMDVLAEGEATREMTRGISIAKANAADILDGKIQIVLMGWLSYLDIWDNVQECQVLWRFNPTLRRFTPEDDRGVKKHPDRHRVDAFLGALSRRPAVNHR
jgi:hypothetical protein